MGAGLWHSQNQVDPFETRRDAREAMTLHIPRVAHIPHGRGVTRCLGAILRRGGHCTIKVKTEGGIKGSISHLRFLTLPEHHNEVGSGLL